MITVNDVPGTEVPGYFHGVPLGRENGLIDWLIDWLIGSLAHWLIGSLAHWLIGSLAQWLTGSLPQPGFTTADEDAL